MNSKLRFGIIGCSRVAKNSTIPAIQNSEFAELVMIGSRSESKAEKFANEFHCEQFGTYDDVISNDSLDAVYISTPVGTHEEWAIKAANTGKHILCEKSSTTSFESAKKMISTCNDNNVRIMEGLMFRFHPQHQKVRELIDNNSIGELFSFNGSFGFPTFPDGDIRYNSKIGGGFLNDAACYPICASRMIFEQEPIGVSCTTFKDPKTGVDIKGASHMTYDNEKIASMTYSNGSFYQAKYRVWGTKGTISLKRAYSLPADFKTSVDIQYNDTTDWASTENKTFEINPANHFSIMINAFCQEITGDKKSSFNFEEDLKNQARVMEAHRVSSEEKRFVSLDEIS
ncbi:MAG: Gfo/Idh/MocA family oxidoreductase [Nitrosopumilus sp.]|nr:Gfo/Idh/MocA family oxidoreductase [Nitrosopumilus sp.]